jgi:3-hydroxyacyl-CoA dehydrogenase/enoyl-CoA hydratase/3-hydroxybutyryl-CoA epimerase
MNVIGPHFIADLDAAIDRFASDDAIKGAVIASGKDSGFMAGMDLEIWRLDAPAPAMAAARHARLLIFDQVFVLNQHPPPPRNLRQAGRLRDRRHMRGRRL